ncbi:uncharacterized protein M421DRAFT_420894 [Didymella exigua CBS 183.55]|uniref:Uncharacterized protein n=1 Tax=Didymella exigua CBS 183.55 TaxID=1150837 RepID=A0A6A5RIZ9_9PLEO|nr:uncharacterized protein M421DRAFT_420894 [Didymella exigua CBS 183.55]KAF1928351.1 hypothetical protein M421DRAFT_420894 [Didymella exigua CBS 183.55]
MHDEHPHPLLAQVPLTVSPFLSLPHSVPLPYSYVTLPSTLPPSILQQNQSDPSQPPQYIQSASGQTAHPDQILRSCTALQEHLAKLEDDARKTLSVWKEKKEREELAEKRRVAPGWLDSGVHMLKPENVEAERAVKAQQQGLMDAGGPQQTHHGHQQGNREAEELDRVFGGLNVK